MKDVRQAYIDAGSGFENDGAVLLFDYGPLLASFEYEIVVQHDDSDYQGDSLLIVKDGGRWGYLEFGWGSCSGCDALQAAGSWGEVAELRDKLANDIVWHDSADEMLKWWDARDWEVQWSYQPDDHKAFFAKARQALVDAVDNTNEQGG